MADRKSPTFAEIGKATPPANQPLDGESLVPLFHDTSARLKRDAIYQHFPGYLGAGVGNWRTTPVGLIEAGDWKLMEFFEDGRLELYNLKDDIGEQKNLATANPEKTKELHDKMIAWREAIKAPMPTKNDQQTTAAPTKRAKVKRRKQSRPAHFFRARYTNAGGTFPHTMRLVSTPCVISCSSARNCLPPGSL